MATIIVLHLLRLSLTLTRSEHSSSHERQWLNVERKKKYPSDSSEETERQLKLLFICEMNVCVLLGQQVWHLKD